MNCSFGNAWFWDEAQISNCLVTGICGRWRFAKKKLQRFSQCFTFQNVHLFFSPRKLKLQRVQGCLRGYSVRGCSQGWTYRVLTSSLYCLRFLLSPPELRWLIHCMTLQDGFNLLMDHLWDLGSQKSPCGVVEVSLSADCLKFAPVMSLCVT